jgi:hypothetical protein
MHKEILNSDQSGLLPILKLFKREFYLVGGTAIALHIGHRQSIDFDFFKLNTINRNAILKKLDSTKLKYVVTRSVTEQLNLNIHNVKFTFFQYPYNIVALNEFESFLKMPDLLTLAAMKAFALGRRSKWKDYVDLYFILKNYFTTKQISEKASLIFSDLFSDKQFRAQLSFFKDIDYSEQVEYLVPAPDEKEIKDFLIDKATDIF